MHEPHRILILAFAPTQMLDVSGPLDVFAAANDIIAARGQPAPYAITLAGLTAGPLATTGGISLHASHGLFDAGLAADTLLVAGGPGARRLAAQTDTLTRLTALCEASARVGSVCCGAFALAATGLLEGCRVTTHWSLLDAFAKEFPGIAIDADALFVDNGKYHTAAGITAGIDYALYLVEQDLGRQVALDVARELVVFLKRPGGQAQFSAELAGQAAAAAQTRFAELVGWIAAHIGEDLSVARLAEKVAMSPRNFTRRFTESMGVAPSVYVQRTRLDLARRLLSEGRTPLDRVALRCGFSTAEAMRLTFVRHLAVTPQEFRARFSSVIEGRP